MHYPHIGEKLGFMVFNNDYAIMDASQEDIFTPLSGNQFMLAVANVHEYGKGIECEDWLISPELSGEEQTIEFKSKTLTDYEEDWAIYISSTDGSVETLRKTVLSLKNSAQATNGAPIATLCPPAHAISPLSTLRTSLAL